MGTGTTIVNEGGAPVIDGAVPEAELFGTRPSRERPHSMNLFGAAPAAEAGGPTRGLDVLLGVGLGAAAMYYFDPEHGARRRSAHSSSPADRIVARTLGAVLTLFAAGRRDVLGAAAGLIGSALLARDVTKPAPPAA